MSEQNITNKELLEDFIDYLTNSQRNNDSLELLENENGVQYFIYEPYLDHDFYIEHRGDFNPSVMANVVFNELKKSLSGEQNRKIELEDIYNEIRFAAIDTLVENGFLEAVNHGVPPLYVFARQYLEEEKYSEKFSQLEICEKNDIKQLLELLAEKLNCDAENIYVNVNEEPYLSSLLEENIEVQISDITPAEDSNELYHGEQIISSDLPLVLSGNLDNFDMDDIKQAEIKSLQTIKQLFIPDYRNNCAMESGFGRLIAQCGLDVEKLIDLEKYNEWLEAPENNQNMQHKQNNVNIVSSLIKELCGCSTEQSHITYFAKMDYEELLKLNVIRMLVNSDDISKDSLSDEINNFGLHLSNAPATIISPIAGANANVEIYGVSIDIPADSIYIDEIGKPIPQIGSYNYSDINGYPHDNLCTATIVSETEIPVEKQTENLLKRLNNGNDVETLENLLDEKIDSLKNKISQQNKKDDGGGLKL